MNTSFHFSKESMFRFFTVFKVIVGHSFSSKHPNYFILTKIKKITK